MKVNNQYIIKRKATKICFMLFSFFISIFLNSLKAQDQDSVSVYKKFILVSKNYQQPPMQTFIRVIQVSNAVNMEKFDSSTGVITFMILENKDAYVNMGEVEQIMMDSTVLIVNHAIKRMTVFEGSKAAIERKKMQLMQNSNSDSALKGYMYHFKISNSNGDSSLSKITLQSRALVKYLNLPKETTILNYNSSNLQPVEIVNTKLSITLLTDTTLIANPLYKSLIVKDNLFNYYRIVEQKEIYRFTEILKKDELKLPFTISDRIIKANDGTFSNSKSYEHYTINSYTIN